ncbi:WxcM-like domain-containing protein [Qipengyuania sp. GPGPB31]|uniref:WxcM-like domain-containing protein n=1 Tax=Qipengyuania sp. GPGPB31 TaxID=3023518 RepID=UPI0031346123
MDRPFIHPTSDVLSSSIGFETKIWQFCVVLGEAVIGNNCNVCSHCFIENDVVIGDDVTIKCGVQLWDGVTLESGVFVGPNASFTNDRMPKSKQFLETFERIIVREGASIGANATILPGVTIGRHAMVGAGAVVTRPVSDYAIVAGNPATIIGYTNTNAKYNAAPLNEKLISVDGFESIVPGVTLRQMKVAADLRGKLSVGEFGADVPFHPKRYFIVYDVPSRETRGEHAHKKCHQFLICVKGKCVAVADDGTSRQEFLLDSNSKGLYMPPMVWGTQYRYSSDAVLLVYASDVYDPDDYIRDYAEFLEALDI